MYLERLNRLTQQMTKHAIANVLITDPSSISYFLPYHTHPGERLFVLLVTQAGPHRLYLNQLFPVAVLPPELQACVAITTYKDGEAVLETISRHLLPGKTAIDKFWSSHFLLDLMTIQPSLQPINHSLVDDLRAIKSPEEQALMRQASHLNDQAMQALIDLVPQRLSEQQMVDALKQIYQRLGADGGFSFEPIVAYGANGADPHHETSNDVVQVGEAIVLDIGCVHQGYCSDMTRTVFYGTPDSESLHVYDLVRRANEAAIQCVRPGVTIADIDRAARQIIEEAGYGDYFTHRTGHFIGREVHEAGDVSSFNQATAQVGQIFSIEPGIYLPGRIGVRIEDLVLVTEDGCEVLNHVSKAPLMIEAE
ncbi:aminopeptidase P family protein [Aerococcaceae bacterium NML191292]|nr:aminopeptidase P family protein [Aerococcaceae bacterium NML191292]